MKKLKAKIVLCGCLLGSGALYAMDLLTSAGVSVEYLLGFTTKPSSQPVNAFAELVAPQVGSTYIDNVLTLQNNSVDADGKRGNAAIRMRDAITGYERAAFGYSGSGDGPTKYYPNTAYIEIGNLSPDAQDTIFRLIATYLPGSHSYPSGMVYFPLEVNPATGDIRIRIPPGKQSFFSIDSNMVVGTSLTPRTLNFALLSTTVRLRERGADDQFAITANVNTSDVKDNPSMPAWRIDFGAGLDQFRVSRMAPASNDWVDMLVIDDSAVYVRNLQSL